MIEIAPASRPPLAVVLATVLVLLALAAMLLRRVGPRERRRVLAAAVAAGASLTPASALLRSERHAGTGTETARGWPRIVHSRWVSFEGEEGHVGLRWGGVAGDIVVHGAASAVVLALAASRRRMAS